MAIIATNEGGGNFPQLENGSYAARCTGMVHIGHVEEEFEGVKKIQNKVRITWEIPSEKAVFKQGEEPKPFLISKDYNLSMHEKATLRKDLQNWRGQAYTEEQAAKVDISKLLGQPCLISIISKESKGKTYSNIGSISKLPKGMICEPQINEINEFNYDLQPEIFVIKLAAMPEFLQNKIKSSSEYKEYSKKLIVNNSIESINEESDFINNQSDDSDLPF